MHIVVCVKQIQNPEIASALLRVDESTNKMRLAASVPPVMSPFDEQAVEAALRVREAHGDAADGIKITAITLGPETARQVLKAALSLGVDEGVLLSDPACQDGDSYSTALTLSRAVGKIGDVDLVITGRQAADFDAGVVGCGLAELLDIPAISFVRKVDVEGDVVRVERVIENGYEIQEAMLPALVTISHEFGPPRKASLRETMRAARKPITAWSVEDLDLEAGQVGVSGSRRVLERLFIPSSDIKCEFINGVTTEDMARELARRLHEANVL
ncbi:MAG: electron transfer flavoprotein subunit beta/FixA family protein [Rhodospirillaceae bacterium]|jgi:electron transfer flavoprotein beta subunit|nr:electron transfer flavoprotein subunit beta/FixA family protein [Rhodospirillaceae bacterium]MBT6588052.1 electron transfer flavoprotein subunit beta/FixA family protein [Rhodospirillaceae bacterium]MBT6986127.1 electron transfer flavoprotein subunit beta/FixA family protein [Rhodospirillaceae bacterium]MBT7287993.1 electron transfer flavoprotein subunit beta/FixA family protein [Rhodospirillaceae bacterium]